MSPSTTLQNLWQDIRYALRTMRRNPAFTAVAVLSLSLGIGANTAIFSVMYKVMLRRLPVEHPEQLVELLHRLPREGHRGNSFSRQAYQDLRGHNHTLSALIAASASSIDVRGAGLELEKVDGAYVDGRYFPVLGMQAAIGRLIGPDDDRVGAAASAVAVLSWSYWNGRFRADPAILGKRIFVQDVPVTIVGVGPRGFEGWQVGSRRDVWLPLAMAPRNTQLQLVGRLKPGVSLEQAHAELAILDHRTILEEAKTSTNPFTREIVLDLEPAGAGLTSRMREEYAKPLVVLMAVVALLLLIACANVASLLLARGAAREREMALRVSLGAGRFRLLRQVLTESVLLSAMGVLPGILLAYFGTSVLVQIVTSGRNRIELQATPEAAVLLLTACASLLTGLLSGLAPALRASASAPVSSLREMGKAGETGFRRLFGKSLVAMQVALSLVLLSAAGLFVSRLSNLENLDMGFQRDRVLLVTLDPARSGYDGERLSRAYQELLARLQGIPDVRSATLSAVTPMSGAGAAHNATVEGYQAAPAENRLLAENWVAPKYFDTLGTPLLDGRDFNSRDRAGPRVAIVNRLMARYYFGNDSPLGRHVTFDGDGRPYEIVGVVGDAKYGEIREKTWRTIYLDTFQESWVGSQFCLRTSVNPAAVVPAVRRTVREALHTVPVLRVTTLTDQVDASIIPERLVALLSGMFAVLGSVLAAVGLYGLLAYTVARRFHEIGIRMALGATRGDVTRMVLADALAMVLAGLAIGAPIALWGKRFAASLIQDLPAGSIVPIVAAGLTMIAVALLAAYVPARRASRVDPMEVCDMSRRAPAIILE